MESFRVCSKFVILCSLLVLMNEHYAECGHTEVVPKKRNENSTFSMMCDWKAIILRPGHVLHLRCSNTIFYARKDLMRPVIKRQNVSKYIIQGYNRTFELKDCLTVGQSNNYVCTPKLSKFNFRLTVYITVPKKHENNTLLFLNLRKSKDNFPCLSDDGCTSIMTCQNSLCDCPKNTVAATSFSALQSCIPLKNIGEDCVSHRQCATAHSECDSSTGKCTCQATHKFLFKENGIVECQWTRQHGGFCQTPSDCQYAKLKNLTCAHNMCVCKSGFKYDLSRGCVVVSSKLVNSETILVIASAPVLAFITFVIVILIIRKKCYTQQKCHLSVIEYLSKDVTSENADTVKLDSNFKI